MKKTIKKINKNNIDLILPILKFVFLLDNSGMPTEIKQAWVAVIPRMSLVQIDKLMNVLEAKYLHGQTKDIDLKYKKELGKLVKKYEEEDDDNSKKLIKQIKDLENL